MTEKTVIDEPERIGRPTPAARRLLWVVGGAVAVVLVTLLAVRLVTGGWFGPPRLNGVALQSPRRLPNITLTDHTGAERTLADFRGQLLLIYFGYTSCPDACPATMSQLRDAYQSLTPRQQEEVQVLLISVDPARDTPDALADYLAHFDPAFVGLTGSEDALLAAATPFGVFFAQGAVRDNGAYDFDHTATVALVDEEGYLRLVYPFATAGDDIAGDVRYLLR